MKELISQRATMWLMLVVVTAAIIYIFSTPQGPKISSKDTLRLHESAYANCYLSKGKCHSVYANIHSQWIPPTRTQARWQVNVKLQEKMYEAPAVVVAQFRDPKRPKWLKEYRLNKTGDRTYSTTFGHPASLTGSQNFTTELTIETQSNIYSSRFRWIQ